MNTWKFTYWFPESERFEWETEVSDEEYKLIQDSIAQDVALNEVTKLESLLWRVYDEIRDSYKDEDIDDEYDNEDDFDEFEEDEEEDLCEGLTVYFQDPNDPFYNVK